MFFSKFLDTNLTILPWSRPRVSLGVDHLISWGCGRFLKKKNSQQMSMKKTSAREGLTKKRWRTNVKEKKSTKSYFLAHIFAFSGRPSGANFQLYNMLLWPSFVGQILTPWLPWMLEICSAILNYYIPWVQENSGTIYLDIFALFSAKNYVILVCVRSTITIHLVQFVS